jgi:hypothetical protein
MDGRFLETGVQKKKKNNMFTHEDSGTNRTQFQLALR